MTASSPEPRVCSECQQPLEPLRAGLLEAAYRRFRPPFPLERMLTCAQCSVALAAADERAIAEGTDDQLRLARRRRASGLPERFWTLRLDDVELPTPTHAKAVHALRGFCQDAGSVFLHGPVGVGKTTLAAAACAQLLHDRRVHFASAPELILGLAADFGSETRARAQQVLDSRDPLVLDDLGQERASEHAREVLFRAIADRITAGVRLVVTSNLPPSALAGRYGGWLASRLAGDLTPFLLPGADRRLQPIPQTQEA